jgi:hypothetical protein
MDLPQNQIVYRWLKVIRSAVLREQNPDWYSVDVFEPIHVQSLSRLMCQDRGRECATTREIVSALADRQGYHVLVAFDARPNESLEHAPIVGHARLVERPNLIETESVVEEVVVDTGFEDRGILRELVLRLEDLSASLGCRRMHLPAHIRLDGFPTEAPTKELPVVGDVARPKRVRHGADLDAPDSILGDGSG